MAFDTSTDSPNYTGGYGYAPYQEAAQKAQYRLSLQDRLLAALSGLGSVRPGAGFGESFLQAAGGSARATWAAKQAAMNYAQRQAEQEQARQDAEIRNKYLEAQTAVMSRPPAPEKPKSDEEAMRILGRPLTDDEKRMLAGVYKEPKEPKTPAAPDLVQVENPDGSVTYVPKAQAVGKRAPKGTPLASYDKLSDNFRNEPTVKDYNTVRDNYRRIESSSKLASGYGDLAMIFSFMKVLDPTSTVREGEFANAQQAMGQLQKMTNVPRQWWAGTRLTPAGRAGLLSAARTMRNAQKATYDSTVARYRTTAKKYGIDPKDFITEYVDTPDTSSGGGTGLEGYLR